MTEAELAEIKARADAATPGPWTATYEESDQWTSITGTQHLNNGHWMVCPEVATTEGEPDEDSDFIAHAREDVPALVTEVERLRGERDALQAKLDQIRDLVGDLKYFNGNGLTSLRWQIRKIAEALGIGEEKDA